MSSCRAASSDTERQMFYLNGKLVIGIDVEIADEYLRYRVREELGACQELLQLDHVATLLLAIERQVRHEEVHFSEWRIDKRSQTGSLYICGDDANDMRKVKQHARSFTHVYEILVASVVLEMILGRFENRIF